MEVDGVTETAANGNPLGRCLASYVDQGTIASHRYFLARRTLLEMLQDRGYVVQRTDLGLSLSEFRQKYGPDPDIDQLRVVSAHRSDPSKQIMVIFCAQKAINVNEIRNIGSMIVNKEGLSTLIMVLQSEISSQAVKAVEIWPFKVEIFQITDLLVNVTKHALKPKHQVLTDAEKQKLLEKYSIQEKQLPRLLVKDAVARYYGFETGQVVKVTHSSDITGLHVVYRRVW